MVFKSYTKRANMLQEYIYHINSLNLNLWNTLSGKPGIMIQLYHSWRINLQKYSLKIYDALYPYSNVIQILASINYRKLKQYIAIIKFCCPSKASIILLFLRIITMEGGFTDSYGKYECLYKN